MAASAVETVTVILPASVVLLPSICTTDQVCSPSVWVGNFTVQVPSLLTMALAMVLPLLSLIWIVAPG
ncbi:Uncharacterised protein [Enterobacter cloacae]|nr:Uncharacterised protein [Enterobacter cloacae]